MKDLKNWIKFGSIFRKLRDVAPINISLLAPTARSIFQIFKAFFNIRPRKGFTVKRGKMAEITKNTLDSSIHSHDGGALLPTFTLILHFLNLHEYDSHFRIPLNIPITCNVHLRFYYPAPSDGGIFIIWRWIGIYYICLKDFANMKCSYLCHEL